MDLLFEARPKELHSIWVEVQEQLTARRRNAGGVRSISKQETKQLGNLGEVQEVTLAAN